MKNEKEERNYGIDALRCVAMFMIVLGHVLHHGGVKESVTGTQFAVVWAIQALVCCAVDVYAIISGYVGYDDGDKSYRYWKIIVLWLQVLIYSVLITVVIQCISGEISVKEIVKACLPVTTTQYWYFSAYIGVFFAAPFVNKVVRNLSEKQAGIAFVFFSIFVGYISVAGVFYDPFIVQGGYSFLWLLIMYIMGAFLKKCRLIDKCCGWRATVIVILCILLSWGGKMCVRSQNIFITYTSFTTILEALMLVVLFANIRIKSGGLQCKIIEYLAPTSFGVYLIHDNPALRIF